MNTQTPKNSFLENVLAQQQNTEELNYRYEPTSNSYVFECEEDEQVGALLSNIGQVCYDWGFSDFDVQVRIKEECVEVWVKEYDEEEEEEDENLIKEGMLIAYRMNFVTVLRIEMDGVWVKDPYGVEQKLDWEDVEKYNPGIEHR